MDNLEAVMACAAGDDARRESYFLEEVAAFMRDCLADAYVLYDDLAGMAWAEFGGESDTEDPPAEVLALAEKAVRDYNDDGDPGDEDGARAPWWCGRDDPLRSFDDQWSEEDLEQAAAAGCFGA